MKIYLPILLIIVTFRVSECLIGQTIDFGKVTISEMIKKEKRENGELKDTIKNFGILKNPHNDIYTLLRTKAYIFVRKDDTFDPQLHIWYHFDKVTNEIKGICYNWGLYNPSINLVKEKERLIKLSKNEKPFKKKYQTLKNELNLIFGKPFKTNTIRDNESGFIENQFWQDDEKIVKLTMNFQRKVAELSSMSSMGDLQIEIMVTYK